MVPYFLTNPGVSAAEAATDLGISSTEVMKALNQLWMCGLPGYGPGDLIDLQFSEESISVTFSAGIDRPLRLTGMEAGPLLVALQSFIETPGVLDGAAARRVIAKIEAAMGDSQFAPVVTAKMEDGEVGDSINRAVTSGKAVAIRYYTATSDSVTHRIIDPIKIEVADGAVYLTAWCRTAQAVRIFRVDRIDSAEVLAESSVLPKNILDSVLPSVHGGAETALLEIASSEAWVLDYYLIDPVGEVLDAEFFTATMHYNSVQWLRRFILGFGGRIRLLNSADVQADVAETARAALSLYNARL